MSDRQNKPTTVTIADFRWDAAEDMRNALDALIVAAEQRAADDGEDDLVEATPELDAARAAVAVWDAVND